MPAEDSPPLTISSFTQRNFGRSWAALDNPCRESVRFVEMGAKMYSLPRQNHPARRPAGSGRFQQIIRVQDPQHGVLAMPKAMAGSALDFALPAPADFLQHIHPVKLRGVCQHPPWPRAVGFIE